MYQVTKHFIIEGKLTVPGKVHVFRLNFYVVHNFLGAVFLLLSVVICILEFYTIMYHLVLKRK